MNLIIKFLKSKVFIFFLAFFILFGPVFLLADGDGKLDNPITKVNNVTDFFKTILEGVIKLSIPIIVLAVVYSGFLFVFARGKPKELETAKNAILYTLIGAGIVFGAWALTQLISRTVESIR